MVGVGVILVIVGVLFFRVKEQTVVTPVVSETPSAPVGGEVSSTANWLTSVDEHVGVSFRYPAQLPTTYIHAQEWPPQVRVLPWAFTCKETGEPGPEQGTTRLHTVGAHSYCVTTTNEGAAGSIYTTYAYAFASGANTRIMTFSLRSVQCANYDEPKRSACEQERASFNLDELVDHIAQTITSSTPSL